MISLRSTSIRRVAMAAAALATSLTGAHQAAAQETAGAFAIRGSSAQSAVLGESWAAYGGGADVALINPATLITVDQAHIMATYHDVFGLGIARHASLSFAFRPGTEEITVEPDRSVTVESYSDAGPAFGAGVTVTTVDLEDDTYTEFGPWISCALDLRGGASIGVTGRYLRASSTIDHVRATGYGLDIGLRQPFGPFVISAGVRNLMGRLSWNDGMEEPQGREFTLAAGFRFFWMLDAVVGAVSDGEGMLLERWNAGATFRLFPRFISLYAGLEARRSGDEYEERASAGASFRIKSLRADYAFIPEQENPGDTHRMTVSIYF